MPAFINADTGKPEKKRMKKEQAMMSGQRPLSFEAACKRFKKRFTLDHTPGWARHIVERTGKYQAPRYNSDMEWYQRSEFIGFATTGSRKYIRENDPTWPVGRWLDKPFKREEFGKVAKAERKAERYGTQRKTLSNPTPKALDQLGKLIAATKPAAPTRTAPKGKISGKKANHRPTKAGKKPTNGSKNGKK